MNIDPQIFLTMAERVGAVCMFDIETTGREADYHSVLSLSIKPHGCKPYSFLATKPGDDRELLKAAVDDLEQYPVWVTYYGKGFDVPFIRTRLVKHGYPDLKKQLHLDMYWLGKSNLLTGRRSQAHLLEWLDTPEKKMTVSADLWNKVLEDPAKYMKVIQKRCESDCIGLEMLYDRIKYLTKDISR